MTEQAYRLVSTEQQWVAALQRREAGAWHRLQAEALDSVYGYLFVRCRRREEAEDLTAEVFAAAYASIDRFRGHANVRTWLFGIARRKLIDSARRRQRQPEVLAVDLPEGRLPDPPGEDGPQIELERRERLAELRQEMLALPETQREALLLRCVEQLPLSEIAKVLGRSENAVKGLLRRARQAISRQLNP